MQKETNNAEPFEYVRGFTEFLGCKINLSKKPLIPRPETEFWVGEVIKSLTHSTRMPARSGQNLRILDIFCGSGCIGLAILKHIKRAKVTFADKYKYFDSPNFIKSDVFSNIKGKFDYIFANPPYVAIKLKHKLQKSVLKFEPKQALFGGSDGLFYIKKFLKNAKQHLNPGGEIFIEFSPEQKPAIGKLLKNFNYTKWEFHKDQFNRWRWLSAS